jgi:hypothetical protein
MVQLSKKKLDSIQRWILSNARPVEQAKWNHVCGGGTKAEIVTEMLKYQNGDGGFGNGFESDILTPESSSIASAEAVFTAQDYGLDLSAEWAKALYGYFERTRQATPSFWEKVPKSLEDHPHPPWWTYREDAEFSPNPCAVVASALISHGDTGRKKLGLDVAGRCLEFLNTDPGGPYYDHDTYCLQRLMTALQTAHPGLLGDRETSMMEKRIMSGVCLDERKYLTYVAQPLDFVDSPESPWYPLLKEAVARNAAFWINTLSDEGIWTPHFSWGADTEAARQAMKNWQGYIAVKRVKILKAFGFVEK